MEKIHSKLRRTDYYDFGHGLTLMNVLFKTEDGKLDRIDTYIGVEGNEFVCGVGPKASLRRVSYFPTANMFDFNEQTKQPILNFLSRIADPISSLTAVPTRLTNF